MEDELHICLLGNFRLSVGVASIQGIFTPRLISLLAYLLLHLDIPQPRSQVAYLFWPETTDSQARNNLRHLLHLLRRSLPGADTYIEVDQHNLHWNNCASFTLDVNSFRQAVHKSMSEKIAGDRMRLRQSLETAIELYTGDLLPDCYEGWITSERENLRQLYLETGDKLVRALEISGEYALAIRRAQKILLYDPTHEESYRRLMRLHALNGDRAEALRVYQSLVDTLQRVYGVSPSPATQDVYERYLRLSPLFTQQTRVPDRSSAPLVGRSRHWSQIQSAVHDAAQGKPSVVVVRGEIGLGKTRLLDELLFWARQNGYTAAQAKCSYLGTRLAYAPVAAWLRQCGLPTLSAPLLAEIARLLPEVRTVTPVEAMQVLGEDGFQRQRLFTALAKALLGHRPPLLLMLDDIHFCDSDTLEWLNYLLQYGQNNHLLLVLTVSPEELIEDAGHVSPLQLFLSSLRHSAAVEEVDLTPLNIAECATLADELNGSPVSAEQVEQLYQESRGVPFILVEMIRAGFLANEAPGTSSQNQVDFDANHVLPPLVLNTLADRLEKLSEPARNLARLAATLDRPAPQRLFYEISGLDEDTLVNALDELVARRIFVESSANAYEFSHPKLRHTALATMSTARRRLLERRVSKVLERLPDVEIRI